MDISSASVSSSLLSQRAAYEELVATQKLANNQAKQDGQAALQLIQSAALPSGNTGHNINVSV